jgi:indole-3-glycerol phosphate synthase
LASGGFDAFLIGETLVKSASPAATLRELLGEEAGTGD